MGYNTTIFILNDGFDQIERHPEQFVKAIDRLMNSGGTGKVGNHANCLEVMPTAHADVFRLYGSHGNTMLDLSPYSRDTKELIGRRPDVVRDFLERARGFLDDLEELLP